MEVLERVIQIQFTDEENQAIKEASKILNKIYDEMEPFASVDPYLCGMHLSDARLFAMYLENLYIASTHNDCTVKILLK